MTQDTVRQIEAEILHAKEKLEFTKAYERLLSNRDFRLVIRDGYLRDEAVRLVHLKADPSMQTPERQASIDRDITSIGSLLQYFRTVEQSASIAAKAIELGEVERDEILNGGDA
jgi:hypothetical protein